MNLRRLKMPPQPDDVSCGPTCLDALYRHYGYRADPATLREEIRSLPHGGTLAVFLALDALSRGFAATIYTYNLHVFDPSWFRSPPADLSAKLSAQARAKADERLRQATSGYLEFLRLGGQVRHEELNRALLARYLERGQPILTGLSATYLYGNVREIPADSRDDDIRGEPCGHFVLLTGMQDDVVQVADPYTANPLADSRHYGVGYERLIGAILLGALTYDANLLVIEPTACSS